jgi:ribosomal protein L28
MKMIALLTLVIFLMGCNGLINADKVKPFIPGTYLASWKTSFSNAVDTMLIAPVTENGSEGYLITRRTHLQFINAANKRAPEYSITKWTGSYNHQDKTIVVQSNGRVLSFDPSANVMRMGNIVYRKL